MSTEEIVSLLKENLQEIISELNPRDIALDDSLVAIGLNSVDRGELITLTLERMGLDIPRIDFVKAQTVGELANLLFEKQKVTMNKPVDEVFELIIVNLKEMIPDLKREMITRSSMLSPLGADSIGRAELIERMLEDLQLSTPRFEFHGANNLGELAEMLARKKKVNEK